MYERFTDRARKVMQLANQEAQRFNHEYIGTEHILLGIVKEGSGTASSALKNFGIDLRNVRLKVEKMIQPGPDMVTMGKLPQTPRAKKVIEYAIEEARSLNHNYVGTEHLLLGLFKEQEGIAAQVLMMLGLDLKWTRQVVLDLLGTKDSVSVQVSNDTLDLAFEVAAKVGMSVPDCILHALRVLDLAVPELPERKEWQTLITNWKLKGDPRGLD